MHAMLPLRVVLYGIKQRLAFPFFKKILFISTPKTFLKLHVPEMFEWQILNVYHNSTF